MDTIDETLKRFAVEIINQIEVGQKFYRILTGGFKVPKLSTLTILTIDKENITVELLNDRTDKTEILDYRDIHGKLHCYYGPCLNTEYRRAIKELKNTIARYEEEIKEEKVRLKIIKDMFK